MKAIRDRSSIILFGSHVLLAAFYLLLKEYVKEPMYVLYYVPDGVIPALCFFFAPVSAIEKQVRQMHGLFILSKSLIYIYQYGFMDYHKNESINFWPMIAILSLSFSALFVLLFVYKKYYFYGKH